MTFCDHKFILWETVNFTENTKICIKKCKLCGELKIYFHEKKRRRNNGTI